MVGALFVLKVLNDEKVISNQMPGSILAHPRICCGVILWL
jgi:hypothetical protein